MGIICLRGSSCHKKTLAYDIQFLPYNNKRNSNNITPLVKQRMEAGGTMTTDMWKAYPLAAEAAQVTHYTVNHSKGFKNPETGAHTNNVEGVHQARCTQTVWSSPVSYRKGRFILYRFARLARKQAIRASFNLS